MIARCVSETATELVSRQSTPVGLFIVLGVVLIITFVVVRCFKD